MDIEKLITEIFQRESLWNQAHPDHHNRYVLEKKWEEVASVIGVQKDTVKSKWKYLRDTFRKEQAKCGKPRSGDAGGTAIESKWVYFKILLFLKDQFIPRKSTSNLPSPSMSQESQSLDCDENYNEDTTDIEVIWSPEINESQSQGQAGIENCSISSTPTSSAYEDEPRVILPNRKRKKVSEDLIGQALLNVEKEKLELLKSREEKISEKPVDEDKCFFESILPHVKNMEPLKKLQFRNSVQDLVMLYAYNHTTSNLPSSGTSLIPEVISEVTPQATTEVTPVNTNTYLHW